MPPVDKRLIPDLVRALPGDMLPPGEDDRYQPSGSPCRVLCGTGGGASWREAVLVSWRRDRLGRWVAQLEYHAEGSTYTESYIYERGKLSRG